MRLHTITIQKIYYNRGCTQVHRLKEYVQSLEWEKMGGARKGEEDDRYTFPKRYVQV